jgi:hypothetical protein
MAEEQDDQKIPQHEICGLVTGTHSKIKSKAIQMVRLIQRGFLEEEKSGDSDFPLNQVSVLDPRGFLYRQMGQNEQQFDNRSVLGGQIDRCTERQRHFIFEDVKRRSVEDHSAKQPDLTFYWQSTILIATCK